jgi:CheY-like chemotaxis protein
MRVGGEVEEGKSSDLTDPEEGYEPSSHDSDPPVSSSSNQKQVCPASELISVTGMAIQRFSRKILIVDDEVTISDTLALIFRSQRYDVRVAYSAERAIEVIAEWRPDLAILDVMLPEMNGIDLAIVIKSNHPCCHVLLFSGHSNTTLLLEEAGRKGHQFEVMAKPVHPNLMLERASVLLTGSGEPAYD